MGFSFSLDPVLRVRELAADAEERALAQILSELEACRGTLARVQSELQQTAVTREQVFAGDPLPAMHLHSSYAVTAAIRAHKASLEKQIQALEGKRVEQIARYEEAFRRREVLVSLQKAARESWAREQEARDGKAADEAFLRKWLRNGQANSRR